MPIKSGPIPNQSAKDAASDLLPDQLRKVGTFTGWNDSRDLERTVKLPVVGVERQLLQDQSTN